MKSITITVINNDNKSYNQITILLNHIAAIEIYPKTYSSKFSDIVFHTTAGKITYTQYCQLKDDNIDSQDFVNQLLEHIQ